LLRKTFFVKPRLQFKLILVSVVITLISTGVLYLTLTHILFSSDRLSELSSFDIQSFRSSFRFSFVWVLLLLMLVFGLESMFRFHRLVGPIYMIEKTIKTIASGDLTQGFHQRKNDELKDLVDELSAMREGLRNFVASDRKACANIGAKLDLLLASTDQGALSQVLKKEIEEARKELSLISSHFKIN
jgi:methyl-accepting chemotaxis protein